MGRTIHVFVRHCFVSSNSLNKSRPAWYSKEKAYDNLLQTKDDDVRVTILLDSTDERAPEHFTMQKQGAPVVIRKGGSDAHSFRNMLDYVFNEATDIADDDIVYLLEEDYVHVPGWASVMREAFTHQLADYVTLYDHPDKYNTDLYKNLTTRLFLTRSTHWRMTPSTTNTYAALFKTLKRDKDIHYQYSVLDHGYTYDHAKFTHLAKENKLLVSSVPALSTHCETMVISPVIDWETAMNGAEHNPQTVRAIATKRKPLLL